MSTTTTTANSHVLVYPCAGSGHIIPLLDLTRHLLTGGLAVTFVITPVNLHLLDPLISSHLSSSLKSLVLPSPQPQQNFKLQLKEFRDLHYPLLLQWFQSQSQQSPPVAIISDFFLGWTQQLAKQVGVRRVVFCPSSAFALSMNFTLWRDTPKVDDPNNINSLLTFHNFPNHPVFHWYQIPQLYRTTKEKEEEQIWEFLRNGALDNIASWGIVLNTSTRLEEVYIEHLKKEVGHDRVWAVGPVMPTDGDLDNGSTNRGGFNTVPCHEVMTWLNEREEGSVVYVCFGSLGTLTSKQMDELAAALEKSGVCFIWCVKQPTEGQAIDDIADVPDGFEDRVVERGYIIKGWAPQLAILRHPAVAVFLTHCGWNSTLEGITAGVVMLTWPMGAEQFLNARLLVEELGVGIPVGEATLKIPEANDLARILAESVNGSRPERVKAKALRDVVLGAVVKGGSSATDMNKFVRSLNELNCVNMETKSHKTFTSAD